MLSSHKSVKWAVTAIAVLAAMMLTSAAAQADIINVPGDFPTIQEAIDAAMDGDEVEVHPGTYNETINFIGKAITVHSSDGPEVTIIDAQQTGTVVTCNSGEGPDSVLEGFTITGGNAGFGGGMLNDISSPTVTNCTFSGNTADYGGGMTNGGGSPTVTHCMFIANQAIGGGGMWNDGSSPTVTDCTFSGNSGFEGGGMYNNFNSVPTVTNCVFGGNNAGGDGADGGAMYNRDSDPLLINCLLTNNEACEGAGGMTNNHSNPVLINCTFIHTLNSFEGALLNLFDSNPTVIGCILWDTGTPPITGRATVTYSCIQGGWRGIGNIEANPMFVDPDGPDNDIFTWEDNDYRLSPGSPCIDAADNTAVPKGVTTDLDGNPRFVDDLGTPDTGNADCVNPIVDMGAYEFLPFPSPPGDLNGDGVVGIIDLLMLLAGWGDCPALPEQCSADLNYDCVVGIGDLLTLLANWG